jgi:homoserine acetyltransferase
MACAQCTAVRALSNQSQHNTQLTSDQEYQNMYSLICAHVNNLSNNPLRYRHWGTAHKMCTRKDRSNVHCISALLAVTSNNQGDVMECYTSKMQTSKMQHQNAVVHCL